MTALAGPLYVVTAVLAIAGLAKIARPGATAAALRDIGVRPALPLARLLGVAELAVATAAVATGASLLWAGVAGAYASFTAFVLWALGRGDTVGSCGCFGREDTPPTPMHAAYNAAAAAVAALAAADPVTLDAIDLAPAESALFAALVLIGIAVSLLLLTHLPRVLALVHGSAPAPAPVFSVAPHRRGRP